MSQECLPVISIPREHEKIRLVYAIEDQSAKITRCDHDPQKLCRTSCAFAANQLPLITPGHDGLSWLQLEQQPINWVMELDRLDL